MSENTNIAEPTSKPRRLSKQALAKARKKAKRSAMRVEIRERRYEVRALRLKGHSPSEIAKKLGVDPSTVSKDLRVIRQEQAGEMDAFDRDQHVQESQERLDLLDQKAWETYEAAKPGSQTRIKALDLIRLTQSDRTKTLVDTGIIKKEEQKVEVTHKHQLDWSDEMREKVAQALIQQSLTPQLEEPTPEDEAIDAEFEELDGTLEHETANIEQ